MWDIESLIVYEDADVCVCHKPAGMLSQADKSFAKDMAGALMTYEKKKGNKEPFIAPVNRLDRPVEGLILYAKNSRAAAALTKQMNDGGVNKEYYAVAQLTAQSEERAEHERECVLENYLLKDAKTNTSRIVGPDTPGAKKAKLGYTVLGEAEGEVLVRIRLYTGRHHQIRVQLAGAGMPLLGDMKYNPAFAKAEGVHNPALCSFLLEFTHPVSKKAMRFAVKPESEAFNKFEDKIRLDMKD